MNLDASEGDVIEGKESICHFGSKKKRQVEKSSEIQIRYSVGSTPDDVCKERTKFVLLYKGYKKHKTENRWSLYLRTRHDSWWLKTPVSTVHSSILDIF